MPIYNVEEYVEESLRSICEQSYINTEIIIVDDGSKDQSIHIVEKMTECYGNVRIIRQDNRGLAAARNVGISEARGKYVCFIDADDIISNDHIWNSVEELEKNDGEVCYSDFEVVYEQNRKGNASKYKGSEYFDKNRLFSDFSERKIIILCCGLLINKEYLIVNNIVFNENLRYGEDVEFMWRLFSETKGVYHVKQDSYKYLQRCNSIMASSSTGKWSSFIEEFSNTIEGLKIRYPEDSKTYEFVFCRTMLGLIHNIAKRTSKVFFIDFVKKMDLKRIRHVLYSSKCAKTRISALLLLDLRLGYYAYKAI